MRAGGTGEKANHMQKKKTPGTFFFQDGREGKGGNVDGRKVSQRKPESHYRGKSVS